MEVGKSQDSLLGSQLRTHLHKLIHMTNMSWLEKRGELKSMPTSNGKALSMKKKIEEEKLKEQLSPQELTKNLVIANGLDTDALEANIAGRVSLSQIWNYIKFILMVPLWVIGIGMLYVGGTRSNIRDPQRLTTYEQMHHNSFSFFMGSILMFIVAVVLLIWLFKQWGRGGFERYLPQDIFQLPQKLLTLVDLLIGRVEMVEGLVTRQLEKFSTPLSRRQSPVYFYMINDELFRVPPKGYDQFPELPKPCRIYYLPKSKVLVNLEKL